MLRDVQKRLREMEDAAREAETKEDELSNAHQQLMKLQVCSYLHVLHSGN